MPVRLHWFLPTNGDSHTDLSLGNAVGAHGARIDDAATNARKGDLAYMSQVARAAEAMGFEAALTPTSSWCEEAWVITAALTQHTRDFKYLVAFRPGLQSPTLAAQAAATYQRLSGGRLLLNVVVGGDQVEQHRYGDTIGKDSRYARADEFLAIVRELWSGEEVDFSGEWYAITGARLLDPPAWPTVYLGGSSRAAIEVAARRADVFLTWGEPPAAVAAKLDAVREAGEREGRELGFGIRLHVITRDTAAEAWAVADRMLAGLSDEQIAQAQSIQRVSESEGQRRMTELHGGRTDQLEVAPNLWAGIGLVRGGAGTALVGSHEEVADRIAEYHDLGIDEFILSGYPHLEEAYRVGEGLLPVLRARGLLRTTEPLPV
ncbi:MAG TPA: LLM class flavin-dependent oxidoreductase [Solirubrobacterales bacterium]|nr:LLM class flavin-dependent oxidoreductase [Solirubrobacterales bacterium]